MGVAEDKQSKLLSLLFPVCVIVIVKAFQTEFLAMEELREVGFKSIQILKNEVLGSGSYGTVCKATCDDLTCAAKILHLVAVDKSTTKEQFEKECKFLSSIRHPNIVLYLGTSQDPDTYFPVLLMELMEESLTQLLEKTQYRFPVSTEVNICHDIALALSFLHSNDIIHRDLSSNNVLMIGEAQAKVTDFGMARLWDTTVTRGSLTKRPGCSSYLPPEADTAYSNKLDCFSFGVLAIQILTGLFPDPSDPFQMVEVSDPKFPNGIEIRVSEAERRKSHIDQISSDHFLLPLALDCINDKESKRPSSSEICSKLAEIKKSSHYADSIALKSSSTADIVLEDIDKLVKEMQQFSPSEEDSHSQTSASRGNSTEPTETQSLDEGKSMEGQLSCPSAEQTAAAEEIGRLKGELEKAIEKLKEKDEQLQEYERQISVKENTTRNEGQEGGLTPTHTKIESSPGANIQLNTEKSENVTLSNSIDKPAATVITNKDFEAPNWKDCCEELERQLETQKEEIKKLNQELEKASKLQKEKGKQLDESEHRSRSLVDEMKALEKKFSQRERASSTIPLSKITIKWKREVKAPNYVSRSTEAMITSGNVMFLRPGGKKEIHAYNIESDSWSKFPDSPVRDCNLTVIKRNLSIVGGKTDSDTFTDKVISLISSGGTKKWVEIYPRMGVKRSNMATILCQAAIVAAGGENEQGFIPTVEVLDTSNSTDTLSWARVADLPEPLAMASATVCAGNIYFLGGWVEKMTPTHSVYTIPAASLLGSKSDEASWKTVASLPTKGSSCASAKGRLIAVGGRDVHQPSTAIYIYDPFLDSWEVLAHMNQPRHQCYASILDDKLIVLGGWVLTKKQLLTETRTIEIADIL